jgi:hypothetical protein
VDVVAHTCMVQISDDPEDSCEAGFKLACLVAETGAHQAAADMFAPLVLRYDDVYGPEHPETLQIKSSHAAALAAAGMLEDAVQLSGLVFECWTAVGGAESEPALRAVRHSSTLLPHKAYQLHTTVQCSAPPFHHAARLDYTMQYGAMYHAVRCCALCTVQYGTMHHNSPCTRSTTSTSLDHAT